MTHPFRRPHLGDILIRRGFADRSDIDAAAAGGDVGIGERLLERGAITAEQLAEALAEQFNLPYVTLDEFTVSPELFELVPASDCYREGVLPYARRGDVLEVAVADPHDLALAERIETRCGLRVQRLLAVRSAIERALKRSEGEASLLRDVSQDFRLLVVKETDRGEEAVSPDALGDAISPVVRLVDTLLAAALTKRASDVHIETGERGIVVKYRIDGVLYPATEMLDRSHHSALVSRLKVMAELDIAERRVPQDGRFKLRFAGRDIDFRLSILPGVFGEDVVIRILDKSSLAEDARGLRLDGLGLAPEVLRKLRRAIREPYGMVLITGPTGSGKTTTLYAALTEINDGAEKIVTIEDPVEYQIDGIVQIPVNEKKGLTFERGLRSILRHDPDKIMVGEIRDGATAAIAVQSALTGHLVFTTVHANNAFDVIGRFSHMGIDVYNFVSALNCVVAQRLVRLICPRCRREARADAELIELSGLDIGEYGNHVFYEGLGCNHCHGTGYRGRAAITELLDLTPRIRELIVARRPVSELMQAALADGLVTLRQSALAKAISGETTLKEINRVTFVD